MNFEARGGYSAGNNNGGSGILGVGGAGNVGGGGISGALEVALRALLACSTSSSSLHHQHNITSSLAALDGVCNRLNRNLAIAPSFQDKLFEVFCIGLSHNEESIRVRTCTAIESLPDTACGVGGMTRLLLGGLNVPTNDHRMVLSSLKQLIVGISKPRMEVVIPNIVSFLQSFLDTLQSHALVAPTVEVLQTIAVSFSSSFQRFFKDSVDLMIGWSLDPNLPDDAVIAISDAFRRMSVHWMTALSFADALLSKLIGDLEVIVSRFSSSSSSSSLKFDERGFISLARCFVAILVGLGHEQSSLRESFCTRLILCFSNLKTGAPYLRISKSLIHFENQCVESLVSMIGHSKPSFGSKAVLFLMSSLSKKKGGDAATDIVIVLKHLLTCLRSMGVLLEESTSEFLLSPESPLVLLRTSGSLIVRNLVLEVHSHLLFFSGDNNARVVVGVLKEQLRLLLQIAAPRAGFDDYKNAVADDEEDGGEDDESSSGDESSSSSSESGEEANDEEEEEEVEVNNDDDEAAAAAVVDEEGKEEEEQTDGEVEKEEEEKVEDAAATATTVVKDTKETQDSTAATVENDKAQKQPEIAPFASSYSVREAMAAAAMISCLFGSTPKAPATVLVRPNSLLFVKLWDEVVPLALLAANASTRGLCPYEVTAALVICCRSISSRVVGYSTNNNSADNENAARIWRSSIQVIASATAATLPAKMRLSMLEWCESLMNVADKIWSSEKKKKNSDNSNKSSEDNGGENDEQEEKEAFSSALSLLCEHLLAGVVESGGLDHVRTLAASILVKIAATECLPIPAEVFGPVLSEAIRRCAMLRQKIAAAASAAGKQPIVRPPIQEQQIRRMQQQQKVPILQTKRDGQEDVEIAGGNEIEDEEIQEIFERLIAAVGGLIRSCPSHGGLALSFASLPTILSSTSGKRATTTTLVPPPQQQIEPTTSSTAAAATTDPIPSPPSTIGDFQDKYSAFFLLPSQGLSPIAFHRLLPFLSQRREPLSPAWCSRIFQLAVGAVPGHADVCGAAGWGMSDDGDQGFLSWAVMLEAARHCIRFRLRTGFGTPAQTLEAFEKMLTQAAANSPMALRRLLLFMFLLEKMMFNAYDGCTSLERPPKAAIAFFRGNKKVCDDWFTRMRPTLLAACDSASSSFLVIEHASRRLNELCRSLAKNPASKDLPKTRSDLDTAVTLLVDAFLTIRDGDAIEGMAPFLKFATKSLTTPYPIRWLTACVLQARGMYESALGIWHAQFAHLEREELLCKFAAKQIASCYSHLHDWNGLVKWQEELKKGTATSLLLSKAASEAFDSNLSAALLAYQQESWKEAMNKLDLVPIPLNKWDALSPRQIVECADNAIFRSLVQLRCTDQQPSDASSPIDTLAQVRSMLLKVLPVASFDTVWEARSQLVRLHSCELLMDLIVSAETSSSHELAAPLKRLLRRENEEDDALELNEWLSVLNLLNSCSAHFAKSSSSSSSALEDLVSLEKQLRDRLASIARHKKNHNLALRLAGAVDPSASISASFRGRYELACTNIALSQQHQGIEVLWKIFAEIDQGEKEEEEAEQLGCKALLKVGHFLQQHQHHQQHHHHDTADLKSQFSGSPLEPIISWGIENKKKEEVAASAAVFGNDLQSISGTLFHHATTRFPESAKAWKTFAGWSYTRGRKVESIFRHGELPFLSPQEQEHLLQVLKPWSASSSSPLQLASTAVGAVFSSLDSTTAPHQLLREKLSSALSGVDFPDEVLDSLLESAKLVYQRQMQLFALSVQGYCRLLCIEDADDEARVTATLRLLRLLMRHGDELHSVFSAELPATPWQSWRLVMPQLLARLRGSEGAIHEILTLLISKVGKYAPNCVAYPLIIAAAAASSSSSSSNGEEEEAPAAAAPSSSVAILDSGSVQILAQLRQQYPQLVESLEIMSRELTRCAVLWEENLASGLSDAGASLQNRARKLREDAARVRSNAALSETERRRIIKEKAVAMIKPTILQLERLASRLKVAAGTPHEVRMQERWGKWLDGFIQQFRKADPSNETDIEEIWQPCKLALKELASQRSRLRLHSISPQLARIPSHVIVIPGEESTGSDVKIHKFCEDVELLPTKTRPKKISIVGTDGHFYSYLLKGREDLHLDERMMQFLTVVNSLLAKDSSSASRNLSARHYAVIPLGSHSGLIRWVDHSVALFTLYKSWHARQVAGAQIVAQQPQQQQQQQQQPGGEGGSSKGRQASAAGGDGPRTPQKTLPTTGDRSRPLLPLPTATAPPAAAAPAPPAPAATTKPNRDLMSRPIDNFYSKLIPALKAEGLGGVTSRKEWPQHVLRKVFMELLSETPRDLLSRELWASARDPMTVWAKSRRHARSVAVMSIVGYIIGLGDRHLDNILLDQSTGEVVHIDWNICFDKGMRLRVPEIVPFRLTSIMQSALGTTSVEGTFRAACETSLRVLKSQKETLLTLLEAFVYDPLVDWTVQKEDEIERRAIELHVSLRLLSSRVDEIRAVPLTSQVRKCESLTNVVVERCRAALDSSDAFDKAQASLNLANEEIAKAEETLSDFHDREMPVRTRLHEAKTLLPAMQQEVDLRIQSLESCLNTAMQRTVGVHGSIGMVMSRIPELAATPCATTSSPSMSLLDLLQYLPEFAPMMNSVAEVERECLAAQSMLVQVITECLRLMSDYQSRIASLPVNYVSLAKCSEWVELLRRILDNRSAPETALSQVCQHISAENMAQRSSIAKRAEVELFEEIANGLMRVESLRLACNAASEKVGQFKGLVDAARSIFDAQMQVSTSPAQTAETVRTAASKLLDDCGKHLAGLKDKAEQSQLLETLLLRYQTADEDEDDVGRNDDGNEGNQSSWIQDGACSILNQLMMLLPVYSHYVVAAGAAAADDDEKKPSSVAFDSRILNALRGVSDKVDRFVIEFTHSILSLKSSDDDGNSLFARVVRSLNDLAKRAADALGSRGHGSGGAAAILDDDDDDDDDEGEERIVMTATSANRPAVFAQIRRELKELEEQVAQSSLASFFQFFEALDATTEQLSQDLGKSYCDGDNDDNQHHHLLVAKLWSMFDVLRTATEQNSNNNNNNNNNSAHTHNKRLQQLTSSRLRMYLSDWILISLLPLVSTVVQNARQECSGAATGGDPVGSDALVNFICQSDVLKRAESQLNFTQSKLSHQEALVAKYNSLLEQTSWVNEWWHARLAMGAAAAASSSSSSSSSLSSIVAVSASSSRVAALIHAVETCTTQSLAQAHMRMVSAETHLSALFARALEQLCRNPTAAATANPAVLMQLQERLENRQKTTRSLSDRVTELRSLSDAIVFIEDSRWGPSAVGMDVEFGREVQTLEIAASSLSQQSVLIQQLEGMLAGGASKIQEAHRSKEAHSKILSEAKSNLPQLRFKMHVDGMRLLLTACPLAEFLHQELSLLEDLKKLANSAKNMLGDSNNNNKASLKTSASIASQLASQLAILEKTVRTILTTLSPPLAASNVFGLRSDDIMMDVTSIAKASLHMREDEEQPWTSMMILGGRSSLSLNGNEARRPSSRLQTNDVNHLFALIKETHTLVLQLADSARRSARTMHEIALKKGGDEGGEEEEDVEVEEGEDDEQPQDETVVLPPPPAVDSAPTAGAGLIKAERNSTAVAAMTRVKHRLEGREGEKSADKLGVSAQVDLIIQQATKIDNLCMMFEGWMPWI